MAGTRAPPEEEDVASAAARLAVDHRAPPHLASGRVVGQYSAYLHQGDISTNNNKFGWLQVVLSGGGFYCWSRWGRIGENGAGNADGPYTDQVEAVAVFAREFKARTGFAWAKHDWHDCYCSSEWWDDNHKVGKYMVIPQRPAGDYVHHRSSRNPLLQLQPLSARYKLIPKNSSNTAVTAQHL